MRRALIAGAICIILGTLFWISSIIAQERPAAVSAAKSKVVSEAVARIHKFFKANPLAAAPSTTAGGPSGQVTTPPDCGKTFTPAQMLTTGVMIGSGGSVSVKAPAEAGVYKFYLYIQVTDEHGEVLREASSSTGCSVGNSSDLGYIETLKRCYCDATKFKIVLALTSISPSDKFALHQYHECAFEVKP